MGRNLRNINNEVAMDLQEISIVFFENPDTLIFAALGAFIGTVIAVKLNTRKKT